MNSKSLRKITNSMSLRKITNSRSLLSEFWVVITAERSRTQHLWEWSQTRCLTERSRSRGLFRTLFVLHSIHVNGESHMYMGSHMGSHTQFIWIGSHTYDCIYIQRNGEGVTHMTAFIIIWIGSLPIHYMTHSRPRQDIMATNESCHTYKWVVSRIWMGRVIQINWSCHIHMNGSCHKYEWVVSHIWMGCVTHMNESCHTQKWAMPNICVTHMNGSYHMYEWVVSHIWMGHLTHETVTTYIHIHIYMKHDSFMCETWLMCETRHDTWNSQKTSRRRALARRHHGQGCWGTTHTNTSKETYTNLKETCKRGSHLSKKTYKRYLQAIKTSQSKWAEQICIYKYVYVLYIYVCIYMYLYTHMYMHDTMLRRHRVLRHVKDKTCLWYSLLRPLVYLYSFIYICRKNICIYNICIFIYIYISLIIYWFIYIYPFYETYGLSRHVCRTGNKNMGASFVGLVYLI